MNSKIHIIKSIDFSLLRIHVINKQYVYNTAGSFRVLLPYYLLLICEKRPAG